MASRYCESLVWTILYRWTIISDRCVRALRGEGRIIARAILLSPHSRLNVGGNESRGRDLFFSRLPCYVIPGLRNRDQPSSRSAQDSVPSVRFLFTMSPWPSKQLRHRVTSRRDRGRYNFDEFRFWCAHRACQDHLYNYSWDDWRDFTTDAKSVFLRLSHGNWTRTKITSASISLTRRERMESAGNTWVWLTWASTRQDIQAAGGSWRGTPAQVRHSQLQVRIAWWTGTICCFRRHRRICSATRLKTRPWRRASTRTTSTTVSCSSDVLARRDCRSYVGFSENRYDASLARSLKF